MANVTVDRRLWLAADRETLVEDGDPEAAFLWAAEGQFVSQAEADRVGYAPAPSAEPKDSSESEQESESQESELEPEQEPDQEPEPERPKRKRRKASG